MPWQLYVKACSRLNYPQPETLCAQWKAESREDLSEKAPTALTLNRNTTSPNLASIL